MPSKLGRHMKIAFNDCAQFAHLLKFTFFRLFFEFFFANSTYIIYINEMSIDR